jgi:hypothetical protein
MTTASAYTTQRVHGHLDDHLAEELLAFWHRHKALTQQQDRRHLPEVLAVLRDADDRIVGANAVRSARVPRLANQPFHLYRCLLDARASHPDDWMALLEEGCDALDNLVVNHGSCPELGLLVQIEQPELQRAWPAAIWSSTSLVYAGYTDCGDQMRLRYYPGARIVAESGA